MKNDLGWTIIAEFVFLSIGGYWLDQKFHTGYQWTFTGILLAVALIVYEIWKMLNSNGDKG